MAIEASVPVPGQAVVDGFVLDPESNVYVHEASEPFRYTDGHETEQRILGILRSSEDLGTSSESLLSHAQDWATEYHFSPARHNLLRHLQITRSMDVLELGAGCGAITRQLGETAGSVWAIEGSPLRASCVAARTRDLPNVRVFCGNFQDFRPDRQFDVVTLIGVLEYAPKFFRDEHPLLACLRLARSYLRPGGTLLLAIENQLGLKYLCGAPEDHTGRPYDGVQDLYKPRGVRTCGRVELTQLLRQAGFAHVDFQFPFPDYKLPRWVFTRRAFETPAFDPLPILQLIEPVHDGRPIQLPLDPRRASSVVVRNGLMPDLANSFLVLASPAQTPAAVLSPPDLLAAGAVTGRRASYNTRTHIRLGDDGQVWVDKRRLAPAEPTPPPAGALLENQPVVEPYCRGTQLEQLVVQALAGRDFNGALSQLRRWIDHLVANGLSERDEADLFASPIKPELFDCNPNNLIVDGDRLHTIDGEWIYHGPLPLRTAVLRYLKPFASRQEKLLRRHLRGWRPPAMQLAARLGIPLTRRQFREANEFRRQINRWTASPARAGRKAARGS